MIIRDAEMRDAEQLDQLLTKLIREESSFDSNINGTCEIGDNYSHRIGLEGHKLILIEENGEILGYLYGFLYEIPEIYQEPIAILDALFVEESHRRRGCASALINRFKSFAADHGACRIELKVLLNNTAALGLYEKLSFVETKKYMKLSV